MKRCFYKRKPHVIGKEAVTTLLTDNSKVKASATMTKNKAPATMTKKKSSLCSFQQAYA